MDLSINLEKLEKKNQNWYSNPYPKIKIFFLFLNYLIRNLQKIWKNPNPNPNPNPNTQQIENPNTNLNLWVLLGAYVCP